MNKIILSFCIATYNRAERVFDLANSILRCERRDIEVVVTDNASTDHTIELLGTITDERFSFHRNECNIGAYANFLHSLTHAKGKYAFYCNDRDYILSENIGKLCDFLDANELSFAYCDSYCKKDVIYQNFADAFMPLARAYHITGHIFNVENLNAIDQLELLEQIDDNQTQLVAFVIIKLLTMGKSARLKNVYCKMLKHELQSKMVAGTKSVIVKNHKIIVYDVFKSYGLLLTKFVINMNCFNKRLLYKRLFWLHKITAIRISLVQRFWAYDKHYSAHYGCPPYKTSNKELFSIYNDYFSEYKKLTDYWRRIDYRIKIFLFKIWLYLLIVASNIMYMGIVMRIWYRAKDKKLVVFR